MSIARFILFWSRKLLLLAILVAIIGLVLISFIDFDEHPNDITQEFLGITENPTQVLSGSEKRTLKKITDANFLNSIRYENIIRGIRKIHMDSDRREYNVQIEPNETYSTSTIQYFDEDNQVIAEVKLFMETTERWYILEQTKIFHIEVESDSGFIDEESFESLRENLEDVKEKVMNGFENFRDRFKLNF